MKRNTATLSKNFELVKKQCKDITPQLTIELIARQLDRADDAKERIEKEGLVVRYMKGSVIPHPAIAVEKEATKLVAELFGRYAGRVTT